MTMKVISAFSLFGILWRYRAFIASSIMNDYRLRFSRSSVGALWAIFNPLAQVGIYVLIFSALLSSRIPGVDKQGSFTVYLLAGLLCWNLFFDIVSRSLSVFIQSHAMSKKMAVPGAVFPVVMAGGCLIDNCIFTLCALALIAVTGFTVEFSLVWLPLLMVMTVLLSLSVGILLGLMNVYVRDVGQLVPIVLQLLFWFTPIVYPLSILSERAAWVVSWNPMLPIVNAYQSILVYGTHPDGTALLTFGLAILLIMAAASHAYKKLHVDMVDLL